jgi:hypothetical protein
MLDRSIISLSPVVLVHERLSLSTGWSALVDHHAIALLNLGDTTDEISAHLPTILQLWTQGSKETQMSLLQGGGSLMARDVWQNQTLGVVEGHYLNATVGPHEVRLFRVWRTGGESVTDGPC